MMNKLLITVVLVFVAMLSFAQVPVRPPKKVQLDELSETGNPGQPSSGQTPNYSASGPRRDTIAFEHRDDAKDSISISFRYLDSTRRSTLDSSVNDFDKYYAVPSSYNYLGNNGAAAFSLLYKPQQSIGFDPGFHAYDVYKFTLEDVRFYRTTRPYSMLSYQLASGKEQMLKASHTQNPKPNFNWGFDYKLISAPGFFVTQNTNHNSLSLSGNYQGEKKRYRAWLALVSNNLRASENGGVESVDDLYDPNRKDRFAVPVNLGNSAAYKPNPFITTITTGNQYRNTDLLIRQSYDLGKKDSVAVNDTTMDYLFYPKLRLQHSITYSQRSFHFGDVAPDSAIYANWYHMAITPDNDTFSLQEKWTLINNDFSLIQYPDAKNQAQFLLGGITHQYISGTLSSGNYTFHNLWAHAEYRNRTRNKLWNMLLKGELYFNGWNAGDYSAYGTISRYINKKFGDVNVYFSNINRSPSFIFDERSSFHLGDTLSLKKENHTSFGITLNNSFFTLRVNNYFIVNYTYFADRYNARQYSNPINLIQVSASKKIKLSKKWYWYADVTVQQTDGAAPIKLPLLYTRNRLTFEGRFFRNLNLCTGIEARYFSPFKGNGYSPVIGQFYRQDSLQIKNLPDITAFLHFGIKSFTAYLRAENLNTMSFANGFGFTNNNFAAPYYPTPGLMIRFGIQWRFVN